MQSSVLTPVSLVVAVRPLGSVRETWIKHEKHFKALCEYELELNFSVEKNKGGVALSKSGVI